MTLAVDPSGLAELAAAERSRWRSSCSRCRMAGGGLSSRLHLTSWRMQAEHGRFSSHCSGGGRDGSAELFAGEDDIIDIDDGSGSKCSYLDAPLPAPHAPIARLCIPKSRHGGQASFIKLPRAGGGGGGGGCARLGGFFFVFFFFPSFHPMAGRGKNSPVGEREPRARASRARRRTSRRWQTDSRGLGRSSVWWVASS